MSINNYLQGEDRGREKEVWEMKKSFFISAEKRQTAQE